MNKKFYWTIRSAIRRLNFQINKMRFGVNQWIDHKRIVSAFSWMLVKTIILQILLNSAIVFAFHLADCFLHSLVAFPAIKTTTLISVVIGGMGIAGVLLALYCSNIASIYSARYTNAPTSVSDTFQIDMLTNKCLKQLSSYIVFCIILLFECLISNELYYVSTVMLLLLTIRVIIAFSINRNRSYQLSNTFRVSDNIYPTIYTAIKRVASNSFLGKDKSFQNHFKRICSKSLDVLKDVALFNKDNPSNQNNAMLLFMNNNIAILSKYWKEKSRIYYNSYWFREKELYQQWHSASDTEINLALKTGKMLNTRTKKDIWWFEDNVIEINEICIKKLCQDYDLISVYSHLNHLIDLSSFAVNGNATLYLISYIKSLSETVFPLCTAFNEKNDQQRDKTSAAIIDCFIGIYINIIISINNCLSELQLQSIYENAVAMASKRNASIIDNRFYNCESIDRLFHQILVEILIEKKRITPKWYIEQAIAKKIFDYCNELVDSLELIYQNTFELGKKLIDKEAFFQAAIVFSHLFEVDSKSSLTVNHLKTLFPALEDRHKDKEAIWDNSHLDAFIDLKLTIQKQIPEYLFKSSGSFALSHWKARSDFPDLLGGCYNHLCEYQIRAIEQNSFELFCAAYKGFLPIMLLYQEYVREDVVNIKDENRQHAVFHVVTAPYVEYAKISGLAILWGEFTGNGEWKNLVDKELKSYFCQDQEHLETLGLIAKMAQLRKHHMFAIGNRDIINTDWDLRIIRAINDAGVCQYEYKEFGRKELITESKLLKHFCGTSFGELDFTNPTEDIYFVLCVNPLLKEEDRYHSDFAWEEGLS